MRRSDRLTYLVVGVFLWLAGVVFIRFTAPLGWFNGTLETVVLYALTPAAMWLALMAVKRLVPYPPGRATFAAVWMSIAALLLDAVAITWLPMLYGAVGPAALGAPAAWLIWAVASGLLVAIWTDDRSGRL